MGLFDRFKGAASADEVSFAYLNSALMAGSCALIDVREPDEFAAGHVNGATNAPLSRFDPAALPKGKPIVLMCQAGGRSAQALARARDAGCENVRHYKGGVTGWKVEGGSLV